MGSEGIQHVLCRGKSRAERRNKAEPRVKSSEGCFSTKAFLHLHKTKFNILILSHKCTSHLLKLLANCPLGKRPTQLLLSLSWQSPGSILPSVLISSLLQSPIILHLQLTLGWISPFSKIHCIILHDRAFFFWPVTQATAKTTPDP